MGSGTARLVVYSYEPGRWFRLSDEVREPVRLGEGFAESGQLSTDAVLRAQDALKLYADFARATGLGRLHVIATSAVREAANQKVFLKRIKNFNLDFKILSGEEEARYGALAVANSFEAQDAWVMDLGGGSSQISRLEHKKFVDGKAYPLGAVRLTEQFLKSNPPKKREIENLEMFVEANLGPQLRQMRQSGAPLIAMGGTIRNLARAVQKKKNYPLDVLHGYVLRREDLNDLVTELLKHKQEKRAEIPGIHPDRADVILAGALVYRQVLKLSGKNSVHISGYGVREGAFFMHFLPKPHLLKDVRAFGIQNLAAHYPQPKDHTEQVRFLARRLFDGLQKLHAYKEPEAKLLDDAAQLHDIGMAVNYFDHHKHGAYLVLASAIPGFTHRQQTMLSVLVEAHRKGDLKFGARAALLEKDDTALLYRLAACLRLAEYLERSRAGRIKDVEVAIGKKSVTITLVAHDEARAELWEARKQAGLFKKAFGRELELKVRIVKRSKSMKK